MVSPTATLPVWRRVGVSIFQRGGAKNFNKPTALPMDDTEHESWQDSNRSWWEANPMRYDWRDSKPAEEFSKEFYQGIDRRFFESVRKYMPWKQIPFDPLIDFEALADRDVLEIGVGNGGHAQLLAERARSFNGIDLTEYAVESTSKRMQCFGIDANVHQMDAERLEFPDESFDFVWSWGVVHHSANTRQIMSEISRVLRPGGHCITMVYHRSLWFYYVIRGLLPGVLGGQFLKGRSFSEVVQGNTDGAIARYYTAVEWKRLASEFLEVEAVEILGQKNEVIPLPAGKLKLAVERALPESVARFVTHTCRQGSFLVATHRKTG